MAPGQKRIELPIKYPNAHTWCLGKTICLTFGWGAEAKTNTKSFPSYLHFHGLLTIFARKAQRTLTNSQERLIEIVIFLVLPRHGGRRNARYSKLERTHEIEVSIASRIGWHTNAIVLTRDRAAAVLGAFIWKQEQHCVVIIAPKILIIAKGAGATSQSLARKRNKKQNPCDKSFSRYWQAPLNK